ncbi:MAG: helix-turn-helix transcriptional regulator [Comamonadaceae bacterium]|nr:helix-turn-helix transcriptional regulator [Comamonadaceae bacterium]
MKRSFSGDQSATLSLRSPPIHDPNQLTAFQEKFEQFFGGIQVEPLYGHPLMVTGTISTFGQMGILIGQASPSRCIHPASIGADDAILMMGIYEGRGSIGARSREWSMGNGDIVFAGSHHPESVAMHTLAHLCQVTLSRSLLTSMGVDVDASMLKPLRGHSASAMMMRYAYMLRDHDELSTPELRRAATLHMHDLAALAMGATGDVAHTAHVRGARSARVLAIKNDIAAHFTDTSLSAEVLAKRQGITPRYLHMLLAREGVAFSALVREQRLALVYRRLRDPRLLASSIQTIAFDAGFGDLSYFNRSFRQRYGMTPSEARIREDTLQ